ncbi:MAG: dihydrofolate reductase [Firmicutes bacterium]|nr:dihydrofolate reductase [Bacillota bacterium]
MKLILAADEKWGIGRDGGLLCHLPGDLKFFKEKTTGKTVIMGRVTLESLPGKKGLPGRRNLVLTRDETYQAERAEVVSSEEELWSALTGTPTDDVFVIGGAKVYQEFLPYCDTCYITKIYADLNADRFFTNLDEDDHFTCEALSDVQEENGIRYQFYQYTRV